MVGSVGRHGLCCIVGEDVESVLTIGVRVYVQSEVVVGSNSCLSDLMSCSFMHVDVSSTTTGSVV